MFRTLILSAAAAGVAAGLVTAALQHVTTTPIILAAETYETAEPAPSHQHGAVPEGIAMASHDEEAWAPADGLERTFYTSLATTVVGVGFALALLGAMLASGQRIDARSGLAFGAAGFAAVALAPALGLPPEIPGSAAAELTGRQLWWAVTVAATAAGLAGLLLTRSHLLRLGGLALIALPHLLGAPHPQAYASTAPAELAGHFAAASLVVGAVFWAALGSSAGAMYERLSREQ